MADRRTKTKYNPNTGRYDTFVEDPSDPNLAGHHEKGAAEQTGTGQADPDRPKREDFPNEGGLAGAAAAEKKYREAAKMYDEDEEFRKKWKAERAKPRVRSREAFYEGKAAGN